MDFSPHFRWFVGFIQCAPRLLDRLLTEEGITDHRTAEKLCVYYRQLTSEDIKAINSERIDGARLEDLISRSGLPKDLARLPIDLFERYCESVERSMAARSWHPCEELVLYTLDPVDKHFILDD